MSTLQATSPPSSTDVTLPTLAEVGYDLLQTTRKQQLLGLARPFVGVAAFAVAIYLDWWFATLLIVFLIFVAVVTVTHDVVHGSLGLNRMQTNIALFVLGVHAVDIDGAREHYHKRGTELYYVLDGEGTVMVDGEAVPVRKGSVVHIPPSVVHGAKGKMRVLVVGIPDIAEDDLFYPD